MAEAGGRASRITRRPSRRGFYARIDARLRPDARAGRCTTAPVDDRHRRRGRRCRRRSCIRTSARSWCPTTTRASSASTCGCRAAPAISAPRSSSQPIEKEMLALPALQPRRCRTSNSGQRQLQHHDDRRSRSASISQQELMRAGAAMLRKYQGARISVSGGTDISGASTRRRRPRRRRRRRRLQPPEHPHPGAGHRAAAELHRAADGQGPRRSTASSTSTPTSSRRSPSCASTSIARAPPTSASTSTRSPTTCARWSAAKKCRSSRTATISSSSCCGSTSRSATIRRRWATC